jgi:hypothetical protein
MPASGLNGRYGEDKQFDSNRSVAKSALPQSLASKLFYDRKMSTDNLYEIPDEEWSSLSKDNLVSRDDVADYMRAYESYK